MRAHRQMACVAECEDGMGEAYTLCMRDKERKLEPDAAEEAHMQRLAEANPEEILARNRDAKPLGIGEEFTRLLNAADDNAKAPLRGFCIWNLARPGGVEPPPQRS